MKKRRNKTIFKFNRPGVFIQEVQRPPSIAPVATAIPVFIGYTEKSQKLAPDDILNLPTRINSFLEFHQYYGDPSPEKELSIQIDSSSHPASIVPAITNQSKYLMNYALRAYFSNGGGPCYVISVGHYSESGIPEKAKLLSGLEKANDVDEITLINFPDGTNLSSSRDYYDVIKEALDQCALRRDRFTVLDVYAHEDTGLDDVEVLRNTLSADVRTLGFGAVYYPFIRMSIDYHYESADVSVHMDGIESSMQDLMISNIRLYNDAKTKISQLEMTLPPSAAVLGVYAQMDRTRGVWKAPANINVDLAIEPIIAISDALQQGLNVDPVSGKSINAIRSFRGRGPAMIWGARTLAGNDNEWRYVPVRRLAIFIEASITRSLKPFTFEGNDATTWRTCKSMIENFLGSLWREGALSGSTQEQGFFVKVGLGSTMTALDVLEGRMIVEIGMAVVRPAEFTILRFIQKTQTP